MKRENWKYKKWNEVIIEYKTRKGIRKSNFKQLLNWNIFLYYLFQKKYWNENKRNQRRRRENGVKWMGFDVMSLNDPFMWIRVNNDDSIARSEANIGQLKSMSSKCAIKRRGENGKSFFIRFHSHGYNDSIMYEVDISSEEEKVEIVVNWIQMDDEEPFEL